LPVKLALIHTSPTLTPLFGELCAKWMPEVKIFHMVDESLIKNTVEAGSLQKLTTRRLIAMVESAGLAGADAVLVTCSSIGEAVTAAQPLFDFPVLRVDEAMAEAAVARGRRIGVLATLRTTSSPLLTWCAAKEKARVLRSLIICVKGRFRQSWQGTRRRTMRSSARLFCAR